MLPIAAALLTTLAENGLGLLSSALQAKGKEVVEKTLNVKIPDSPSPEDVSKLRQLQYRQIGGLRGAQMRPWQRHKSRMVARKITHDPNCRRMKRQKM